MRISLKNVNTYLLERIKNSIPLRRILEEDATFAKVGNRCPPK